MDELTVLSWNVNGIRAVYKKGFLDWLTKESPDILCVQETKAAEDQLPFDLKMVEGYHAFFSSSDRKGYSGVALYTKSKPASIATGFGIPRFDSEGRILIADYDSFVLFNIYFPNGKASPERLEYKLDFYDAFLDYVNNAVNEGKNVIVCGDVNTAHKEIDLAHPKENSKVSGFLPVERAWMDKFVESGYIDTFRHFDSAPGRYTWWDLKSGARERNVGWRIDYFFVNAGFIGNVKRAYILPNVTGSDHCPTGVDITI
ncbi:MAG: exodeoxyribonuclease III [Chloroflexota bacterium]|nr:exodeoxyribonuclease III [Chloroflexota bacterium]